MTGQQWEYCQLCLYASNHWAKGGVLTKKEEFWGYDCNITYYCPNGDRALYTLAALDAPLPFNPFTKTIGLLGTAGWELVSIQHGTTLDDRSGTIVRGGPPPPTNGVRWDNCVAYFKRPSIRDRAVDEPKIKLIIEASVTEAPATTQS